MLICARSFWCDEAMLALNITQHTMRGLTHRLDWNQAAPVAFLLAEKMMTVVAGASEGSLRVLSFVAGVGCLVVGAILARRYFGRFAGLTAVALLAASDTLIYYSNELKQYEIDAFFFLLFVNAMLIAYESKWKRGPLVVMTAIGGFGMFFSFPVVFAMGGFFLSVLILEGVKTFVSDGKRWVIIGTIWAAAFALDYWKFLRPLASSDYLHNWWRAGFPPGAILSVATVRWMARSLYAAAGYSLGGDAGRQLAWLVAGGVMVGMIRLWHGPRQLLCFLGSPVLLAIGAALIHAYPFEGRVIVFLVPGCLLVAAAAADTRAAWRWVLAAGLVLWPGISAAQRLTHRDGRQELRPVLEAIKGQLQPNDTIYVYSGAWVAFQYYRPIWEKPGLKLVAGVECGDDLAIYAKDVEGMRGRGRVWLILTNVTQTPDAGQMRLMTIPFAENGRELTRASALDAEAILYDMP
jgi:hypothetical protein